MSVIKAARKLNVEIFAAIGADIKTTLINNGMDLEIRNGHVFGNIVQRSIVVSSDGAVRPVEVVGRGRKQAITYTKQIARHGDYVFSFKGGHNIWATYAHICLAGELYAVDKNDNIANHLMVTMKPIYHDWLQAGWKQPTSLVVGDAFNVELWSAPATRRLTTRERLTQDLNRLGDDYIRRSGEVACNFLLKTVHRLKDEITKS